MRETTFGGRYGEAPILAVSPRPDLALGPEARAHLDELGVTYVVEPLNNVLASTGSVGLAASEWWGSSRPR